MTLAILGFLATVNPAAAALALVRDRRTDRPRSVVAGVVLAGVILVAVAAAAGHDPLRVAELRSAHHPGGADQGGDADADERQRHGPARRVGGLALALGGAIAFAGGQWFKLTLVTRAGYNQGFAIPHLPVRGVPHR